LSGLASRTRTLEEEYVFPEIGSSPHHFFRLANIGNLPHRETKEEMEASIMTVLAKGHSVENRIFAVSSPSNTRQNQFMLL
jgi:hypothetical protein